MSKKLINTFLSALLIIAMGITLCACNKNEPKEDLWDNSPQEVFDGLTFRPVFANGLKNSTLSFSSGSFGTSIDTSSASITYGSLDNFMSKSVIETFPNPLWGVEHTVIAEKEFGKERLVLLSTTLESPSPEITVTINGEPAPTNIDAIYYLATDESVNGFVYAVIHGTSQEDMENLNRVLESYK